MFSKDAVGTKVVIVTDCRDGSPATGKTGVYEGDFPRTVLVKYNGEHKETMYDWFMSDNGKPWRESLTHVADMDPTTIDLESQDNWWSEWKNPRIRLDDGSVIWGDECWWKPVEAEPQDLDKAREEIEMFTSLYKAMVEDVVSSDGVPVESREE